MKRAGNIAWELNKSLKKKGEVEAQGDMIYRNTDSWESKCSFDLTAKIVLNISGRWWGLPQR